MILDLCSQGIMTSSDRVNEADNAEGAIIY